MRQLYYIWFLFLMPYVSNNGGAKLTTLFDNYDATPSTLIFDIHVYTIDENIDFEWAFDELNNEFSEIDIEFNITDIEQYNFPEARVLKADGYEAYRNLSKQLDFPNKLCLWIVPTGKICDVDETSVVCNRPGGWAFVESNITNNIVLTDFDVTNPKILIHEFGHFFGLDHTFEEHKYGKEDPNDCENTGDRICDTPYDPNIHGLANYGICELKGYKTLVNNYMSYYKPCYMRKNEFTPQQFEKMRQVAFEQKLMLTEF